jgi:hypothetical protein
MGDVAGHEEGHDQGPMRRLPKMRIGPSRATFALVVATGILITKAVVFILVHFSKVQISLAEQAGIYTAASGASVAFGSVVAIWSTRIRLRYLETHRKDSLCNRIEFVHRQRLEGINDQRTFSNEEEDRVNAMLERDETHTWDLSFPMPETPGQKSLFS